MAKKESKFKKFKKATKILLFTNGLVLIAVAMLAPIYAIFVDKVGGDLMDASIAGGIFALSAGVTSLISGKITDNLKKKTNVVVFGYFLMGIGFFLYTIVDSVLFLFFVQALIGFGEAIYSPSFDALYGNNLNKKQRGLEWGAWESMNYFTIAIGAFIGGLMVTYLGFNSIFIFMGLLCFGSGAYLYSISNHKKCKIKQK